MKGGPNNLSGCKLVRDNDYEEYERYKGCDGYERCEGYEGYKVHKGYESIRDVKGMERNCESD